MFRTTLPLTGLALMLAGVIGPSASAQTVVVNPSTVEFTPSSDHSALLSDGRAVVERYEIQFYLKGTTSPTAVADLGKPTPAADRMIRVEFASRLAVWPLANGSYEARVVAIGPSGQGTSDPSNAFSFAAIAVTPPESPSTPITEPPSEPTPDPTPTVCTISLTSTASTRSAAGGQGALAVAASASSCTWSAMTTATWVVLGLRSGTGAGAITYSTTRNTTGAVRTALILVNDQRYSVAQEAGVPPAAPKGLRLAPVIVK